MNIGFVGLGKLGFPIACFLASVAGVSVVGYDTRPVDISAPHPQLETGPDGVEPFDAWRARSVHDLTIARSLADLRACSLTFVAVHTPHHVDYGGHTPAPATPRDFDYTYLNAAAMSLRDAGYRGGVAIISTCLPGTTRRVADRYLRETAGVIYNPSFIAMGTVLPDFTNPEFLLMGREKAWPESERIMDELKHLYMAALPAAPSHGHWESRVREMSWESAELAKVAYNTWISQKIVHANTLMELCQKTPGADVDEVTGALGLADRRLWSPYYTTGGMGDGGGCHPRDNIAMQYLAQARRLSANPYTYVVRARERQARWLAELTWQHHRLRTGHPRADHIVVLGYAFKGGTNLTDGSPAELVGHYLAELGALTRFVDPLVDPRLYRQFVSERRPATILVGCAHEQLFKEFVPAPGSTVIDPFRRWPDHPGVNVVRVGRGIPGSWS